MMHLEDPKACEFIDWLNTEFKILIIIVAFLIKYNNYDRGDIVEVPKWWENGLSAIKLECSELPQRAYYFF